MIGLKAGGRLSHQGEIHALVRRPGEIGRLFLTDHLLAFEITSIVLLVAAVGGVILGTPLAEIGAAESRSNDRARTSPVPASPAFLFATGALGVLIRRSPLIVLLSLEIMLNGANLALIAFSRHFAQGDGQIFALTVMAVAASEVVVGLGLIVAMARKQLDLDVDKLTTLRG